jgi:predicted ATPase
MTYILGDSLLLNPRLTEEAISYLRSNWVSIINRGITKKVAQEASQLTYDAYEDLTIEPYLAGRYAVYAYMKDGRRVRLGDLGDGLQSYMVSRILYEVSRPQLLLWDDVEAHFNPRILHAVALWIGDLLREGRQAVVSTHSLEAVWIIAGVNEEQAKIQLTHLKDGQLKLRALTFREVEELAKAGVDVRVGEQLLI